MSAADGPGAHGDLIIMAAASIWDAAPRIDRHLAEHLADDRPVLYVEPPVSRRRAGRDARIQRGLRQLGPRLWVLGPVVLPAKDRWPVSILTDVLTRTAVRRAVRRLGLPVDATISSAPMRNLFGAVSERRRIYWVLDDYVAGAHLINIPRRRVLRAVAARSAEADDIVVVSPGLQETFRASGYASTLVPNGADVERFSTPAGHAPVDADLPKPVIGYVGGITDRIDPVLLRAVAERGWALLLVGPLSQSGGVDHLRPILDLPNVTWVGERSFDELPAYMAAMDVGIVPYRIDAFNVASFPLKALEYLAAGREVVAADLPALRWLATEHVHLAADPRSFIEGIEHALQHAGDPAIESSCRAVAAGNGWSERAASFLRLIDEPSSRGTVT